jgi:anthranilate 1,2-dioxygenase large subunit
VARFRGRRASHCVAADSNAREALVKTDCFALAPDFSRISFSVYHSAELYEEERKRIFRGPLWSYLCLDVELPEAGSFLTTYVGDVPVLVNRTADGKIRAFENRCMHRGTKLRRELRGKDSTHSCVYHQWCYDLDGGLKSVPFAHGVRGHGGLPKDFDKSKIHLIELRVASFCGVLFGSFDAEAPPLEDYLGDRVMGVLRALFHKPVKVLGYQRQHILGNWKLYNENLRDPNHGGLLHAFHATFGLARLSQKGGAHMDDRFRHNISFIMGSDDAEAMSEGYRDTRNVFQESYRLRDTEMLKFYPELPTPETLIILSVFPNVIFQMISNSLCTRQIRPRGVDEMELYWTYYGFADDTAEMTEHRRVQANMVGPGGLVSMEDGEAVELVHNETRPATDGASRVIIGGVGPLCNQESMVSEVPIRGFWRFYFETMGLE